LIAIVFSSSIEVNQFPSIIYACLIKISAHEYDRPDN